MLGGLRMPLKDLGKIISGAVGTCLDNVYKATPSFGTLVLFCFLFSLVK